MPDPLDRLTPAQRRVFVLLAQGFSDRAIAGRLCLALSTVKTHVRDSRAALGMTHRGAGSRRWFLAWIYQTGYAQGLAAGQQQNALAALRACLGEADERKEIE